MESSPARKSMLRRQIIAALPNAAQRLAQFHLGVPFSANRLTRRHPAVPRERGNGVL